MARYSALSSLLRVGIGSVRRKKKKTGERSSLASHLFRTNPTRVSPPSSGDPSEFPCTPAMKEFSLPHPRKNSTNTELGNGFGCDFEGKLEEIIGIRIGGLIPQLLVSIFEHPHSGSTEPKPCHGRIPGNFGVNGASCG